MERFSRFESQNHKPFLRHLEPDSQTWKGLFPFVKKGKWIQCIKLKSRINFMLEPKDIVFPLFEVTFNLATCVLKIQRKQLSYSSQKCFGVNQRKYTSCLLLSRFGDLATTPWGTSLDGHSSQAAMCCQDARGLHVQSVLQNLQSQLTSHHARPGPALGSRLPLSMPSVRHPHVQQGQPSRAHEPQASDEECQSLGSRSLLAGQ